MQLGHKNCFKHPFYEVVSDAVIWMHIEQLKLVQTLAFTHQK